MTIRMGSWSTSREFQETTVENASVDGHAGDGVAAVGIAVSRNDIHPWAQRVPHSSLVNWSAIGQHFTEILNG